MEEARRKTLRFCLSIFAGGLFGALLVAMLNRRFGLPMGWALLASPFGGCLSWLVIDFEHAWAGVQRAYHDWCAAMDAAPPPAPEKPYLRDVISPRRRKLRRWDVIYAGGAFFWVGSLWISNLLVFCGLSFGFERAMGLNNFGALCVLSAIVAAGTLALTVLFVAAVPVRLGWHEISYRYMRSGGSWWERSCRTSSTRRCYREERIQFLRWNLISIVFGRLPQSVRFTAPFVRQAFLYVHSELRLMAFVNGTAGAALGGFFSQYNPLYALLGGVAALIFGLVMLYGIVPRLGKVPS